MSDSNFSQNFDQLADGIKIGSLCKGRRVTADDHDRWEQQRQERKARNHTLNPYRY